MCLTTVELHQSTILAALNGSEVPGDFYYSFSVVTGRGTARGIAVPHVLVFGVSDLGQP